MSGAAFRKQQSSCFHFGVWHLLADSARAVVKNVQKLCSVGLLFVHLLASRVPLSAQKWGKNKAVGHINRLLFKIDLALNYFLIPEITGACILERPLSSKLKGVIGSLTTGESLKRGTTEIMGTCCFHF